MSSVLLIWFNYFCLYCANFFSIGSTLNSSKSLHFFSGLINCVLLWVSWISRDRGWDSTTVHSFCAIFIIFVSYCVKSVTLGTCSYGLVSSFPLFCFVNAIISTCHDAYLLMLVFTHHFYFNIFPCRIKYWSSMYFAVVNLMCFRLTSI
jgi:hypothetical protein